MIEKLLLSIQTKPEEKKQRKKARRTKAQQKKKSKKVTDDTELHYTRVKLKKAISDGQMSAIIAKGDCIQFILKDERQGFLVNAQGAIRRFTSEKKAWDLIEQLKE
ncbi:MAG: hypothetical protein KZQ57_08210 [gamma proteobacterium symbiont of Lucinoma myriamae]|nr:hypothetical protein [gamma proteobacterium symbiont of Lucinoma myriamae]